MSWWNPLTWGKAPDLKLKALPIDLNPDASRQLHRAVARFERVKAAIRKGDKSKALVRERVKLEYLIEALKK